MKKYNDFVLNSLNESNSYIILEKKSFSSYKQTQKRVFKEYGSQLYFVATFNSAIVSMYPVVAQIINNSDFNIKLSTYQIVLLTIFAIAEILHVNNDAVNRMRKRLMEEGIFQFVEEIKKTLLSLERIVKVVAKTIGKTISLFVDMLAYVAILVPINDALIEILKEDQGLNLETLPKKILGLSIGLGVITLKHMVIGILDKMGMHTSSKIHKKVDEIIDEEKSKNVYHRMGTKEKIN